MSVPDLDFRVEPLATPGDRLALVRRTVTASAAVGGRLDVGAFEIESLVVQGTDAAERLAFAEVFASDGLLDVTACLHERFAASLPEGPERTRAAGIARTLAAQGASLDPDRIVEAYDPSVVCVDHRSLGTWSSGTLKDWIRQWRGQTELADSFTRRDDDIFAFTFGVTFSRHTYFGVNRASGGPFENVFLAVNVFGADGRYTRSELFEPDQEVAALARFEELCARSNEQGPS